MSQSHSVRDNAALSRFEMDAGGDVAFARYHREGGSIIITHVETRAALRGHGVASNLMESALDLIRRDGSKVVGACSFARTYLTEHPEYSDLKP